MREEDIKRAKLAQDLLDNPLLDEVLKGLKNAYITDWLSSKPEDTDARERLYIAAQVVDDFARNLRVIVENGAISKAINKRKQEKYGL